jgi:hypothetical protein
MYSAEQLQKGLKNPSLAKNHIFNKIWGGISVASRMTLGRRDAPIPERDWDNLLLLDACRYDLFEQYSDLPGELEQYYSVASNTAEYVRRTFKGEHYSDIVCVTSTPKYYKPNVEDSFHDIIHVWKDDWDEDYRTVLPEVMNRRVLEVSNRYPNKRILAHYIPPHQPFIGETGQQMPHQVQFSGDVITQDMDEPNVWQALRSGKYSKGRVWKAYRENLELTLPAIEEILDDLQGKTVVTSDHGNVFGRLTEFGIIGHPANRHIKPLIEVPWLIYQNGDRKDIEMGGAVETLNDEDDLEDDTVEERLSDLGYLD